MSFGYSRIWPSSYHHYKFSEISRYIRIPRLSVNNLLLRQRRRRNPIGTTRKPSSRTLPIEAGYVFPLRPIKPSPKRIVYTMYGYQQNTLHRDILTSSDGRRKDKERSPSEIHETRENSLFVKSGTLHHSVGAEWFDSLAQSV